MRMNHPSRVALALVMSLASGLWPAAPSAADGPDPSQVYVRSVTYGGSGCPQGTVGSSFSADRKTFTLIFDSFVASIGHGVPNAESRKTCQLNVILQIPQGFSYSVNTTDYRGFVQLDAGVTAVQKSIYYFSGEISQASAASTFNGPLAKDYLARDTLGLVSWSPCGSALPLNINTQVRLSGGRTGQITTDSVDNKVKHILGFQWRRC